ncbi:MAG TPA: YciI family protein [Streptosporangiaceae bacterium]|nr:YciI family protein [Streptosporangiaceae bacterium]
MTQYLLAVHHASAGPDLPPEEWRQSFADVDAFNEKLTDAGAFVFTGGLLPDSATVVRQSGSDFLITDGPYAETKEHLGGFWVISAADLDAALEWAKLATVACRMPIEVSPFDERDAEELQAEMQDEHGAWRGAQ